MSLKAQILDALAEAPATSRELAYAIHGEATRSRVSTISAVLTYLGRSGAIKPVGSVKHTRIREGYETLSRPSRIWGAA